MHIPSTHLQDDSSKLSAPRNSKGAMIVQRYFKMFINYDFRRLI